MWFAVSAAVSVLQGRISNSTPQPSFLLIGRRAWDRYLDIFWKIFENISKRLNNFLIVSMETLFQHDGLQKGRRVIELSSDNEWFSLI